MGLRKLIAAGMVVCCAAAMGLAQMAYSVQEYDDPGNNGNHDVDIRIVRPWVDAPPPDASPYPVIVWANGWDQGNNIGEFTTLGYLPGLIEWAVDGPYIVIACNQWSAQEQDILSALEWAADQNALADGEYEGLLDMSTIGLAGHSMGGGVVVEAGDGEKPGNDYDKFDITATLPMNPWGPEFVKPEKQDGPMLLLGGTDDGTTPTSSFQEVFDAVKDNKGGILADLDGGTHNSEAWAPDDDYDNAHLYNFGRYQEVSELWWRFNLKNDAAAGRELKRILDQPPWFTQYGFTYDFEL